MQTIKQILHDVADHLPEQAMWDDAVYALYVRQKIEEGLRDVAEDRTLSHADAMTQLGFVKRKVQPCGE